MLVELQRLVLGNHTDIVNAGIGAITQRKVNDAILATKGYRGLGCFTGQLAKAGSLSAGQNHCNNFCFHAPSLPFFSL